MASFDGGAAAPANTESGVLPLDSPAAMHFGVYVDGIRQADEPTYADALARVRELGRGFVWLTLEAPPDDEMRSIAETFDLHPLAVDHVLRGRLRPKVEWYDDHLVIAMRTLGRSEYKPDTTTTVDGQIAVFVSRDFLITCGRGAHTAVAEVRRSVENSPVPEPSRVMHAIADRIVGEYLEMAALIRADADLVEEQVFAQSAHDDLERIYFLKREIVHMRRSIEPLTHALSQFAAEHGEWISTELRHNMKDVMEQNIHAVERMVGTEALVDSLMETTYGRDGTQQNADMRKISAWAAIGAVPTTLAGIYGMRFPNLPALHSTWGYPGAMGVMVVVTGLLYRAFHRKRWL